MVTKADKGILLLIGSLTCAGNSLAHQIDIDMDKENFSYTSPVIYLTGVHGNIPKVAIKEGMPTTGGIDENIDNLTDFNLVTFQSKHNLFYSNSNPLKIISMSFDPFCGKLDFSIKGNKILLPTSFPKLTESTSCHFKIMNTFENMISRNDIIFIFNYTLKGWLGDLGNGTEAQKTAEILKETNPNATNITFDNQNIIDISPVMAFINTQTLSLNDNKIRNIPDALRNLVNLQALYLSRNKIRRIPNSIKYLKNLQFLAMSNNDLLNIPDAAIENLSKLEMVNLSNNSIVNVDEVSKRFWRSGKFPNLSYLDLKFNLSTHYDNRRNQRF